MKKYIHIITLATLALLAASSCQKEEFKDGNDGSRINSDEIGFSIAQSNYWNNNGSGAQTKAAGDLTLFSADGDSLCLSLSVSDNLGIESLPDQMTKGAMVTADNWAKYISNIGVSGYLGETTSAYINMETLSSVTGVHEGAHWETGTPYYWPKANTMDFWAWTWKKYETSETPAVVLPVITAQSIVNVATSDKARGLYFSYTLGTGTGTSFKPANAVDQPDLLFSTISSVSPNPILNPDNDVNDKGCVPLEFKHALASVRFKINADYDGKIESIKIGAAAKSGDCVFVESASAPFVWDNLEYLVKNATDETKSEVFAQSFSDFGVTANTPQLLVSNDSKGENAANFMMIPQTLKDPTNTSDTRTPQYVTIKIKYADNTEKEYTGPLYQDGCKAWLDGRVYTYTITIPNVNVTVEDDIVNDIKQDLAITNTGNVNAYIRAAIIGHWVDSKGHILNTPWNISSANGTWEDGSGTTCTGSFVPSGNWVASDGYYYYKKQVAPKATISEALFTSYTFKRPSSVPPSAHLELFIAVQAVPANQINAAIGKGWSDVEYLAAVDSGE